jgi:multiple sugar transport system permease protein/raffinose/stachyose/melibiose transport system permease protein
MTTRLKLGSWATYGFLTGYALFVVGPFAWMIASSFKDRRSIFTQPFSLPSTLETDNYARAWEHGIGRYLVNSLTITAITVVLVLLVSSLAAYALARLRFPGRTLLYALIVAGYAVPIHTVLVPLYRLLDSAGALNSYAGLILPYVAFGIPFSIVLLYAFFLEFPTELEEAARLDGCKTWSLLWYVVLPLSLPAFASVAIFQGVFIWNEFILALLVISDESKKTLPLGLVAFRGEYANDWGAMMAAITIATAPLLLLYIVLQRHFIRSLAGIGK